jgi:hypothetical protein
MHLQWPNVEVDGDRFHGSARARLGPGGGRVGPRTGMLEERGSTGVVDWTGYGRPAPTKSPPRRSPVIQTDAPVKGASIMLPGPTYIAT